MRAVLQRLLDRAEDFATRRCWMRAVFRLLQLKRALGLRFWR